MKKVFYLVVATVFALSFASCKSEKKQKSSAETQVENVVNDIQEKASDLSDEIKANFNKLGEGFFGTYVASLPGVDNEVYETTVTFNADMTYNWSQKVIGIEDVVTEEGKITNVNDNMVITLTANDGSHKLLKVIDGKLLKLNDDGSEPSDATREANTFTRK